MHSLATLRAGGYRNAGIVKLKLTEHLDEFPIEILDNENYGVADTLEILDLSGTGLSSLPASFGPRLPRLRIAFFSNCEFKEFPRELADCPCLEMVAFRSNGMTGWAGWQKDGDGPAPEFTFPPLLRWLILTENKLESIPHSIGRCSRLEKCMLAGNRLTGLPDTMADCRNLTLLRLAANKLQALPPWLLNMPKLAFLSFAGNPCAGHGAEQEVAEEARPGHRPWPPLPYVEWERIEFHHVLGEGASGVISKGTIRNEDGANSSANGSADSGANSSANSSADNSANSSANSSANPSTGHATPVSMAEDPARTSAAGTTLAGYQSPVAIKIFRGALTSDGTPYDEMAACLAAGQHVNLVRVHGQIRWNNASSDDEGAESVDGPSSARGFRGGLIMELIPPEYRVLGLPPSFETCTRDCFEEDEQGTNKLSAKDAIDILSGVASAAAHLHGRGITHGDLYAHNILVSRKGGNAGGQGSQAHAILSDFGASTMYGTGADSEGIASMRDLEKLEVLAFGYLVADVLGLMGAPAAEDEQDGGAGGAGGASTGTWSPPASFIHRELSRLHDRCAVPVVADRPVFATILEELGRMEGRLNADQNEAS